MNELEQAKQYWQTHHHQGTIIIPEGEGQDHRYTLARHILSLEPESVLEFGCSSGRNLKVIQNLSTKPLKLFGIDMNSRTVAAANKSYPDINVTVGDENELKNYADNSVDVVFTCSVLDHIPSPTWKDVYLALVRIAKKAVVLLEPVYRDTEDDEIYEGDLSLLKSENFPDGMRVVPFTYSWNYRRNDSSLRVVAHCPIPTDAQDSGEYYWLMERKK